MVRCLNCNYELSGLTEHRCPECGRGFDPSDADSYFSEAVVVDDCRTLLRYALFVSLAAPTCLSILLVCKALNSILDSGPSIELLDLAEHLAVGFLGCITPVAMITASFLFLTIVVAGWRCRRRIYPRIVVCALIFCLVWGLSVWIIVMIGLPEMD